MLQLKVKPSLQSLVSNISLSGAQSILDLVPGERVEKLEQLNNEMNNALKSKKKRKLSIDIADTDDENNKLASKKIKLEPEVSEAKELPKGATRRQLDVLARQEEKERKEKEKGPAWTYELVPVVSAPSPAPAPPVFGQFVSGRCCLKCEEPGGVVWRCRGQCNGHYHPKCLQVDTEQTSVEQFRCEQCTSGQHPCAVCHSSGGQEQTTQFRRTPQPYRIGFQ